MSETYIPLYRKYRPQKLEEVVGQEHIKQALSNAITLGKISHAYLFTGPRGTGKTSTARILAKSLNCIEGPTVNPCGKCASCVDITNTVPIDVIEIDAASNRKVEDAQNILEKIQYVPVNGKYKIYIIDEVHMLTNTAFNALLKTLEEPPKNVVFILATTESHKVLDTIKSRCQRFDFRRITTDDIAKHLRYISDKENIKISDGALYSIAKNSAGGMRDSIALLDQVSILGESKEITEDDINNLLGRISFDVLNEMAQYIIDSDSINAVKILEKVYNSGNEPVQILSNLMYYFKNLLIVKNCDSKTTVELTNLNEAQIKELEKQKEVVETHQIVFLIEKIADYIKEIKATVNQQMWLEVALIDLSNLTNNTKLIDLQTRLQALESGAVTQTPQRRVATPVQSAPKTVVPQPIQPQSISKPVENSQPKPESKPVQNTVEEKAEEFTPMPKAKKLDPSTDIRSLWGELLSHIKSPSTHALLKLANPVKIAPDEVVITFKQSIFVKQASEGQKKIAIMEAADEMFGQKNTVVNIRTPLESDVDLGKIVPAKPKPQPTVAPKTLAEPKSEISEEEAETVKEVTENKVQEEEKKTEKQHSNTFESDQSKMIKELFDGKYIN
mgnify:FL=1